MIEKRLATHGACLLGFNYDPLIQSATEVVFTIGQIIYLYYIIYIYILFFYIF